MSWATFSVLTNPLRATLLRRSPASSTAALQHPVKQTSTREPKRCPPLYGSEGYEVHPLLYQPGSGNGVTPTHESYSAAAESISDEGGSLRDDDGYETEFNEGGTAGSEPSEDFDEYGLGPLVEGSSIGEEIHPLEWGAPDAHNEHGPVR
ncbi:hypothetical protein GCM10007147_46080 [Nocardiopsis kunsanensis]|uniref:Uncharacterized protein n=1 Tax=Nocardiopsis kunsanensis TaxID=141693 RepID=A0A918XM13_9ACTN|nr:hypothetical protein [Nocardiopsis kunsanensis]GHD37959.1 hypothetical protein GCM10007147_46080 [Nocardiopsis kunsanensis]